MEHAARLRLFDAVRAEQGSFLEAILWRLTGDGELFVEALQDSLLQMWRHVEKLHGPAGRTYLYRVAQTAASHAWRRRVGAVPQASPWSEREWPQADLKVPEACRADRPDEVASRKELIATVRRAISDLPELQARAITLRYLEQKDYDLMAREMGCPEVTLRSYVSKGLATLRNLPAFVGTEARKR